jgi:hypothetical protein
LTIDQPEHAQRDFHIDTAKRYGRHRACGCTDVASRAGKLDLAYPSHRTPEHVRIARRPVR